MINFALKFKQNASYKNRIVKKKKKKKKKKKSKEKKRKEIDKQCNINNKSIAKYPYSNVWNIYKVEFISDCVHVCIWWKNKRCFIHWM